MFNFVLLLFWLHLASNQVYYANQNSNNIVSPCHCDVTTNFCDYNCCCDPQCSEAINNKLSQLGETCQTNTKLKYCLDKSYYAFINQIGSKEISSGQLTCYEYDGAATWQAEVAPSSAQINNIVKSTLNPLTGVSTFQPYTLLTPILTVKQLIQDGKCIAPSTAAASTPIYFGRNLSISCIASQNTACQNSNISLFSQFIGKNIISILGSPQTVTIPSIVNSCISQLDILVFFTKLGSSSTYIISDIRTKEVASATIPTQYTLKIYFIDLGSQLDQQNVNQGVPFFPQIPPDMFYPIFYNGSLTPSLSMLLIILYVIFYS